MSEPQRPPQTVWDTVRSVGAAFFGVQSSKNRARDFKHGKASHFIAIGLVATAIFVGLVVVLVRIALHQAGR